MVAIESNNIGHFDNGLTHSLRLCLDKIILSMRHNSPVSRSKLSKTVAVLSYQSNGNYLSTNVPFSQDIKDSSLTISTQNYPCNIYAIPQKEISTRIAKMLVFKLTLILPIIIVSQFDVDKFHKPNNKFCLSAQ